MTGRQCEIAAEAYTACLLAQAGYDVLVQYGANQPHYDLMAVKHMRKLPISVKGSQDGGWMLAVKYVGNGVDYHEAIDKWLSKQREDVVYVIDSTPPGVYFTLIRKIFPLHRRMK
jgi:hypothetical protein